MEKESRREFLKKVGRSSIVIGGIMLTSNILSISADCPPPDPCGPEADCVSDFHCQTYPSVSCGSENVCRKKLDCSSFNCTKGNWCVGDNNCSSFTCRDGNRCRIRNHPECDETVSCGGGDSIYT